MPSRSKSRDPGDEITQIEEQIADLQDKLRRLNDSAQRGASRAAATDVDQFVKDALDSIMERVRDKSDAVSEEIAERAAKAGSAAFQRMVEEVEHYPLATLAVAAGIGFLLGSARR
jgi:ElaB/YqjD/DUF883 family membrane-anchored ribosome-binding protein